LEIKIDYSLLDYSSSAVILGGLYYYIDILATAHDSSILFSSFEFQKALPFFSALLLHQTWMLSEVEALTGIIIISREEQRTHVTI
jgi:hypothetical protein